MISCSGRSRLDMIEPGYISTTCSFRLIIPSHLIQTRTAVQLTLSSFRLTLLLTTVVFDQHGGT